MITKFKIFENNKWGVFDYNYKFDKSKLQPMIDNARKYDKRDFIETYVDYNNISIYFGSPYPKSIKKGDEVEIVRLVLDNNGRRLYKDGQQVYSPYKKVVADKDYNQNHWEFILDNTKELQEEAAKLYDENQNKTKPKFKKTDKTIRGFHASPYKFKTFKYLDKEQSGQIGAGMGFFFFTDIEYAKNYASTFDKGYIYECDIKLGKSIINSGEELGTNWGRATHLEQMRIEGYDTVIIEDADTGYGITDEIIVFDDDNINIIKIHEVE